jgi:hypothetical protein
MNVVIEIEGREAVPVRAIPLLTHWEEMAPDSVVAALADPRKGSKELTAYALQDGEISPVGKRFWQNEALTALAAVGTAVAAAALNEHEGLQRWRNAALLALPAGVFVWLDEYEPWYLTNCGPEGNFWIDTETLLKAVADDQLAELAEPAQQDEADDTDAIHEADESDDSDEIDPRLELDFSPFMTQDFARAVAEGFDEERFRKRAVTTPASLPVAVVPPSRGRAQEERVMELLITQGFDPLAFPKWSPKRPGAKAQIKKLAIKEKLFTSNTFDDAWDRLRKDGRIKDSS